MRHFSDWGLKSCRLVQQEATFNCRTENIEINVGIIQITECCGCQTLYQRIAMLYLFLK